MILSTKQVDEIVRSVLDVTLHLDPDELRRSADLDPQPHMVRAQVCLNGAWKGQVLMHVAPELAREMAAVMCQSEPAAMGAEESFDAVGELTNMIAGNLRPLIPGSRSLSVPTVTDQGQVNFSNTDYPIELSYRLDGMKLCISVAGNMALAA